MTLLAIILIVTLIGFYASQCFMAVGLIQKLRRNKPASLADADCPKAAVILCLRGKDPFLDECIQSLLSQDYPDYQVHVVIDHESDPSRSVVQATADRLKATNLQVEILVDHRETCGLKCSSLLHAMGRLDASREVVALLDADTSPHPTWLRELVAPLLDSDIGAATGNRWYMPANPSVGATVRYFWNVFAIMQMVCFRIAWGGSLAIKMDVVRNTDLLTSWGRAFCEDTMLYSILRKQGLRLAFVPSLIMINREDCSIGSYFRWVRRQLLTARLYHPAWSVVLWHGILSTILPLALLAAFVGAMLANNGFAAALIAGGTLAYGSCMLLLLWPLEQSVRQVVISKGEKAAWMSQQFWCNCAIALPLLQLLYPLALVLTVVLKQVDWRGVQYRIESPWQVRLIKYQPYVPADDQALASL